MLQQNTWLRQCPMAFKISYIVKQSLFPNEEECLEVYVSWARRCFTGPVKTLLGRRVTALQTRSLDLPKGWKRSFQRTLLSPTHQNPNSKNKIYTSSARPISPWAPVTEMFCLFWSMPNSLIHSVYCLCQMKQGPYVMFTISLGRSEAFLREKVVNSRNLVIILPKTVYISDKTTTR